MRCSIQRVATAQRWATYQMDFYLACSPLRAKTESLRRTPMRELDERSTSDLNLLDLVEAQYVGGAVV